MTSQKVALVLLVVASVVLLASASEAGTTLYSCPMKSSSCSYRSTCLGRYATAGRYYYFREYVGCCMCVSPGSCYGCRNFGECNLLKTTCTVFGSPWGPSPIHSGLPGWAVAVVIIVPIIFVITVVSIIICCLCCASCVAWRASMRNHHEVEMVGMHPVVVQPAQVETLYFGPPATPNQWQAVAPGSFHMHHGGVAVHAVPQAATAQLYVPLNQPIDDDPFY